MPYLAFGATVIEFPFVVVIDEAEADGVAVAAAAGARLARRG
jgi:hypothetical protein